jgi:transcriptional regulator with XRE-family HTH domain
MHMDVPPVPKDETISPRHLDAALLQPGAPTAADLAERIGVDVGTLSRWRRGVAPLSRTKWIAILAVLGLPLDWKPAKGSPMRPAKRGRGRPRTRAH